MPQSTATRLPELGFALMYIILFILIVHGRWGFYLGRIRFGIIDISLS